MHPESALARARPLEEGALTAVVILALAALALGTGEIAELVSCTRERSVRAVMDLIAAIGERKRADEALHRLNLELESRVQHRTQELAAANAQLEETLDTLRRAQQELVRTEKLASLGSLVAGIAHELSTPVGNSLTVATTLADRTAGVRRRGRRLPAAAFQLDRLRGPGAAGIRSSGPQPARAPAS